MSVVEEGESGFSIRVSGRLVFIRHWGNQTSTLGQAFAEQYKSAIHPLLTQNWAEIVDLTEALSVEDGHKEQVACLYEREHLLNNVATAYVLSVRTSAALRRNVNQLVATQTTSFSDKFFSDPIEALNWVNQRLAMAR